MSRALPPALARMMADRPFAGPEGLVDWARDAAAGEAGVYHVGMLACDCEPPIGDRLDLDPQVLRAAHLAAGFRRVVADLAALGLVTPTQRRHGADLYEYRVTRTAKAWTTAVTAPARRGRVSP